MRTLFNSLKKSSSIIFLILSFSFQIFAQFEGGGPQPGEIYKEYQRTMSGSKDWRVTDPNATHSGAQEFLPNSILAITLDDYNVSEVIRVEMIIDLWQGHPGTSGKKVRFKANESTPTGWITIPELSTTPTAGYRYMSQWNPIIEIPKDYLVEGVNYFEGTSGPQLAYNFGWGQWGWYGVIIRVYYDKSFKDYPTGSITSQTSGNSFSENPILTAVASSSSGIQKVDFLAYYENIDFDGDGVFKDWQRSYHKGIGASTMEIQNHVGSDFIAPYQVTWDTDLVPDQLDQDIKFIARIKDNSGMHFVTDVVDNLTLSRIARSVKLYKPELVQERYWVPWGGTGNPRSKNNRFTIPAQHNLSKLVKAKFYTSTWGNDRGSLTHSTTINGTSIPNHGYDHYYKYDLINIDISTLINGSNTINYMSNTTHHGIEVLWPGPGVIAEYDENIQTPPIIVQQPQSEVKQVGESATFTVIAEGNGLSYQWRRDGSNISGANTSTYSIASVQQSDNNASFDCVITNTQGSVTTNAALLVVIDGSERTELGLQLLYTFREGSGTIINDVSGVGSPLNLTINSPGSVIWGANGLSITSSANIISSAAATKVITGSQSTNEISIETWLTPTTTVVANTSRPARIVTISTDGSNRNVTLGQGAYGVASDLYDVRLRTTSTTNNGTPSLSSPNGSLTTTLTHVVYTRKSTGEVKTYINGIESVSGSVLGTLGNWNSGYRLAIGNEVNAERPWLGELSLVGIYDRALSEAEILQNYAYGAIVENPSSGPVITSEPTPATVYEGETATFNITATGTGLVSYQWQRDGVDIGGAISSSYTTPVTVLGDNGSLYRCIITDDNGSTISNEVTLTVQDGTPVITQQPADTTISVGETAIFSVAAVGLLPLSYQWQKDGADIGGATSSSYTTPVTVLGDNGSLYRCVITNSSGSITSSEATLTVLDGTPVITQQPVDITVNVGQTAMFSVTAIGTLPLSYQWQKDGVDIVGATDASYTTPVTILGDNGSLYRCVITNTEGNVISNEALLTVEEITVTRTELGLQLLYTFREGSGTIINDVSGVGSPLNLTINSPGSVIWGANGLSITSSANIISSAAATKVITGSQSTNEISIETWLTPTTTVVANTSRPARIVTISTDGSNRNVTLGQGAYGVASDLYDVRLRTTSTTNNGTPSLSSPNGSLTTTLTHVVYTRKSTGEVKTYINGIESVSGSVLGTLGNWNSGYRLAIGNEVNAERPWLGELSLVGIYDRALSEAEILQNYAYGAIVENPSSGPVITSEPTPATVYEGETATFNITATGTGLVSYQWQRDGVDIGGAISSSYTTPVTVLGDNGSLYRCIITDDNGSTISNEVTLTVQDGTPVITQQPADTTISVGETAIFSVAAVGLLPLSYQWQKDGADIGGATSSSYTTPVTVLGDNGSLYRCVITNSSGSITSSEATLTVLDGTPVITQQPVDITVNVGQTAMFSVTAIGTLPLSYQWQKDGVDIVGATDASYTTPVTILGDNGSLYRCVITNTEGNVISNEALLTVEEITVTRTELGLQLLYTFREGSGTIINDVSGVGSPLNLTINSPGSVIWGANGLSITSSANIISSAAATKVITGSQSTNEISIETWLTPTTTVVANTSRPARIVTISTDGSNRNVTLGQGAYGVASDLYDVRLRTTSTTNNGTPSLSSPNGSLTTTLTHVVYTRKSTGEVKTYINGIESVSGSVLGTLGNWNSGYRLAIGNEVNAERPWLGELSLVGIYDRALSEAEILQNYAYGAIVENPSSGPVITSEPTPATVYEGETATFNITATGTGLVSYQWQRDGVDIGGAISSSYTTPVTVLGDNGSLYRCIITDDNGSTISNEVTLTVQENIISAPTINVWYGDQQNFGHLGKPQRWVNIIGNISDPDGIQSVTYTVNDNQPSNPIIIRKSGIQTSYEFHSAANLDNNTSRNNLNKHNSNIGIENQSTHSRINKNVYKGNSNIKNNPNTTLGAESIIQSGSLNLGPDTRRLLGAGDFNIEIEYDFLVTGLNTVEITATDLLGNIGVKTVTVNFTDGVVWSLPYSIDWQNVTNVQDAVQIVDGNWKLENNFIRTNDIGYDRTFALGDVAWEEYEVTVPFIIHGEYGIYQHPSYGPALGVIVRWNGHTDELPGFQPRAGFTPYGAFGWYTWVNDFGTNKFQLFGNDLAIIESAPTNENIIFNQLYFYKMRIETTPQGALYKFKYWMNGETEPDWKLSGYAPNGVNDPTNGSILLFAHHVDASIGNISVIPLTPQSNLPPIADFNFTVDELNYKTINFNAASSYDPDGSITDYSWDFGDGNGGTGQQVSHTYAADGNYNITLTVADDSSGTNTTAQQITVEYQNMPPTAQFQYVQDTSNFLKIDFDANTSSDTDGNILLYSWDFGDGTNGAGVTTNHTYGSVGIYNVELVVTDDSSATDTLIIPINVQDPSVISNIVSDDFNSPSLNTGVWNFVNPLNDASYNLVGYNTGNATLEILVPGGVKHDVWTDGNKAPRIMQQIENEDFEVEVKFESPVNQRYQLQGFIIQESETKFIRYDFYTDGDKTRIFAGQFDGGSVTTILNGVASNFTLSPLFLKINRSGNNFELSYKIEDSGNWVLAASMNWVVNVSSLGVFAGNSTSSDPSMTPAFTSQIDYFFNTASPIDPEDGILIAGTLNNDDDLISPKDQVFISLRNDIKTDVDMNELFSFFEILNKHDSFKIEKNGGGDKSNLLIKNDEIKIASNPTRRGKDTLTVISTSSKTKNSKTSIVIIDFSDSMKKQQLLNFLGKDFKMVSNSEVKINIEEYIKQNGFIDTLLSIRLINEYEEVDIQYFENELIFNSFDIQDSVSLSIPIVIYQGNRMIYENIELNLFSSELAKLQADGLPSTFELLQNYPNPFNPSTTIKFGLPENSFVQIDIYNVVGERVETLLNKELEIGYHYIDFNSDNLASGIYFYRIRANNFIDTKKMILLK